MNKNGDRPENLPLHVAIIPDGNRRWARQNKLKLHQGHETGVKALRSVLEAALDLSIPYFSFWGSSKDNILKRPKPEVQYLFYLFEKNFNAITTDPDIHENKVRVNVLGEWEELVPEAVKKAIRNAIDSTRHYDRFTLNFFIGYNGTDEMKTAISRIVELCRSDPDRKVDFDLIKDNLLTRGQPPVDLLIRTGGEPHLSVGFMMWDLANAQLYFSPKLWPDFTGDDFRAAIRDYASRERRFSR